jgi:hypothetical protein
MSWQAKLATVLVGNLYRVVLSRLHEESSFKKCARYSRLHPSRHLSEAGGNTTREGSFLPPAIMPRGAFACLPSTRAWSWYSHAGKFLHQIFHMCSRLPFFHFPLSPTPKLSH